MRCARCQSELIQDGDFWVCPEHGPVEIEPTSREDLSESASKCVFISYGRSDGLKFVQKLSADLKRHGQRALWVDLEQIKEGDPFDVRIEQGIQSSDLFAAVMTRRSLEEDSVCRDEVVFAFIEGRKIVPLRIDPDPKLKPSLLLARRHWIDFTESYETGLRALLRFLQGDESVAQPPELSIITGVIPLDFGPEIARFSQGFTGREWINAEIDSWLSQKRSRALVIIGEPGIGKSAIAAWLTQSRSDAVVAIHFCTQHNSRTKDPREFVASLVGHLVARIDGFGEAVAARSPEIRRSRAADAFRELIVEPANNLRSIPTAPRLIVVDSLDEAATHKGETIIDVLVEQVPFLPDWLRVVTTTRPEYHILNRIRALSTFELDANRKENRHDIRRFIDAQLQQTALAEQIEDPPAISNRIHQLAEGNFLYARMALEALEDETLSVHELDGLSPGLTDFYAKTFMKRFSDVEEFSRESQSIFRMLSASMGPVPFGYLDRVSRQPGEGIELTNRRLQALRPYLRVSGKGRVATYALFHRSLADWLADPDAAGAYWCDEEMGHTDLADACWVDYQEDVEQMAEYALRYVMLHLRAARRDVDANTLSKDTVFQNRRLQMGLCSLYLCYARGDDEPFVARLYRDLSDQGFDVWLDRIKCPTRLLTFHQEVRDAITMCDRLLLVIGPVSTTSDYVKQEWRFALDADKAVAPVLRLGDYSDVPDELKLLHCEDFRDDAQYPLHLRNLCRQLLEKAPPLGKLIGVPALPPSYLVQLDRIRSIKQSLLADLERPVVIHGSMARVAVYGMGGIGKTVLATAIVRDQQVRRAFPDGIVWASLGSLPTTVDLQRHLHRALGGDGNIGTEREGKMKLTELLADKAVLLVLDDASRRQDLESFDVLGPRCRALITTRDADLATSLGGTHCVVDLLTEAEGLSLLAEVSETPVEQLPDKAHEVLRECGRLPLAVAMCGALIRRGMPWQRVLDQLQQREPDQINAEDPDSSAL